MFLTMKKTLSSTLQPSHLFPLTGVTAVSFIDYTVLLIVVQPRNKDLQSRVVVLLLQSSLFKPHF